MNKEALNQISIINIDPLNYYDEMNNELIKEYGIKAIDIIESISIRLDCFILEYNKQWINNRLNELKGKELNNMLIDIIKYYALNETVIYIMLLIGIPFILSILLYMLFEIDR